MAVKKNRPLKKVDTTSHVGKYLKITFPRVARKKKIGGVVLSQRSLRKYEIKN